MEFFLFFKQKKKKKIEKEILCTELSIRLIISSFCFFLSLADAFVHKFTQLIRILESLFKLLHSHFGMTKVRERETKRKREERSDSSVDNTKKVGLKTRKKETGIF